MAGAIIVIDQPTGAGAGTPGVARNDLWQTQQVNLSVGTGGNSSYQWNLLDIPAGSATTLAGPTTSTPTFTPDLAGTYRVQLITNGGGPGNVQILVARVRFDGTGTLINRGWAPPGFGEQAPESNYGGNLRGWSTDLDFIFADLLAHAFDPGFTAGGDLSGSPTVQRVSGIEGALTKLNNLPGPNAPLPTTAGIAVHRGDVSSVPRSQSLFVWDESQEGFVFGTDTAGDGVVAAFTDLYFDSAVLNANILFTVDGSAILWVNGSGLLDCQAGGTLSIGTGNAALVAIGPTEFTGDAQVDGEFTVGSTQAKPALLPMSVPFVGIAGLQQTGQTAPDDRGYLSLNPATDIQRGNSTVTTTITYEAVLQCALGGAVQTCSLELYNVTDGITVHTLSTTNNVPTFVSAALVVGGSAGQLPNAAKLYALRLTRTGGTSSDLVGVKLAQLLVNYQ